MFSQLLISACDGLNKCDYGYLDVTVDSNLFAPVLTNPSSANSFTATVTVLEDIGSDHIIYTVEGRDDDATVRFSINLILHWPHFPSSFLCICMFKQ